MRAALTIGRFVALEARRTGLALLLLASMAAGIALAGFLSQLALTESAALQAGMLAALFRLCAVFLTAVFVATSMVRESGDKVTELLLSLPVSRTAYYFGKLGGYAACGGAMACAYALLLLVWSPAPAVGAWLASLVLEVALVAAVSLFFVITLAQVVPALAATAGMYLLARSVAAIQSISASPLAGTEGSLQTLAVFTIDLIALLLPPLERATQTVWLLYEPPALGEFLSTCGLLLLYGAVAVAAGLFDFHRRNL